MAVINITVTDHVPFTEHVGTNQHVIRFIETLTFTETSGEAIPNKISVFDVLTITDTVHPKMVRHLTVSDTLPMFDSPYKGPLVHVHDTFTFTQITHVYNFTPHIRETLVFHEAIRFDYHRSVAQNLVFKENVNVRFLQQNFINDTLTFQDHVVLIINSPEYLASQIDDEPGGPNAVLVTPSITTQTTVVFSTNSHTLTLRAPDFGNADSVNAIRIQRVTRGNELITYRDPLWSRSQTFTLSFSYISDADALLTQTFINETLGQLITYVDYEGNSWVGIVQTPQLEIKKVGRYNNSFTITFEVI